MSRLVNKFKCRCWFSSPSSEVSHHNNTTSKPSSVPPSQPLVVPASVPDQPYSSYLGNLHDYSSPTARANITAVSPSYHGSSSPDIQGSAVSTPIAQAPHSQPVQSGPIASENPAPPHSESEPIASGDPATCASRIPTSTPQAEAAAMHIAVQPETKPDPDAIEPPPHSGVVWGKTLEIAQRKLSEKNLPLLDLTKLISQSAEENILAVVKDLTTIQEDDKKSRWRYTWRGKEVVVVECLGKILKTVEKYSKVVDTTIQSNPEVAALVWGAVRAIMQVSITALSLHVV